MWDLLVRMIPGPGAGDGFATALIWADLTEKVIRGLVPSICCGGKVTISASVVSGCDAGIGTAASV